VIHEFGSSVSAATRECDDEDEQPTNRRRRQRRQASRPGTPRFFPGLHSGLDLLGEQAGIGDIEFAAPNHPDLAAPATFD
jgi:hypothetical protein